MDSATYWKNREAEQRKHSIRDEKEYQKRIHEIFQNMIDEMDKEINGFYGKYASKEGITISEARKRAAKLDIEAYAHKAKKYVKEKNFSDEANAEMRLYNMTMRVNRLELLKAQIGLEMIAGFDELQKFFDEKLTDRATGEFERLAGILGKTVQDNAKAAHAIVNASFHNATFSDRIWMYQDMLKAELSNLLQTGLIRGQSSTKLATHLRKRFGVSQSNAERLMTTELRRVQTDAARQVYERNGNTEYKFLTTNPQGACDICKKLDGKVFKVKNMAPGTNAPPMHPWCHCTTAPYWNNDEFDEWLNSGSELNFADWKNQKDNSVAKKSGSGIMNASSTKEDVAVHTVGKIDRDIYKCVTEDIVTDEVIITDERIEHIKERHPNDYERFYSYIPEIINDPDFIVEANKPNTAVVLKEIEEREEKFKLVLRIKVQGDPKEYKNSVMTFWRIGEKTWKKTLKNKMILYKKE